MGRCRTGYLVELLDTAIVTGSDGPCWEGQTRWQHGDAAPAAALVQAVNLGAAWLAEPDAWFSPGCKYRLLLRHQTFC